MTQLVVRLLKLTPVGLLIVAVNVTVDPGGLFHSGQERKVAALLRAGKNVAVTMDNLDERLVQRNYIGSIESSPEWIVLGSSRALSIRPAEATCTRFFNHSMSGATIEDFLAVIGLYGSRGMLPTHVILTIDPWIVNRHNDQPRWQSIRDEYEQMARTLNIASVHPSSVLYAGDLLTNRAAQAFSLPYFQASLRFLVTGGARTEPVATTADGPGDRAQIMCDGSLQYPRSEYARTPADIVRSIRTGQYTRYSLNSFTEIDRELERSLNLLVTYLTTRRVDVTLVLIPYHPLEYRRIATSSEYSLVAAFESDIRQIAARHHLQSLGSYNPAVARCEADEFLDAIHPRSSCLDRILRPLGDIQ